MHGACFFPGTAAVGNDTGPLHLAALTGTPTLGFFGVTDARAMLYRMPWFREVRVSCPRAGCRDYGYTAECLADISPEKALLVFRELADSCMLSLKRCSDVELAPSFLPKRVPPFQQGNQGK